jgi:hypothetical protein
MDSEADILSDADIAMAIVSWVWPMTPKANSIDEQDLQGKIAETVPRQILTSAGLQPANCQN